MVQAVFDGSTKIVLQENKEYKQAFEMPVFCLNLWQRLQKDIEEVIRAYRQDYLADDGHGMPRDILRVPEPVSLYQQSKKNERPSYM